VERVDGVVANVGKRLRALRRARRRTLEDIAGDTGYTTGYLSQIETGEAVPSLTALAAISASLGADITAFFPPETSPSVRVSRAGDSEKLRIAPNSREEYVVLARGPSGSFTALVSRYFPGDPVCRYSQFGERFAHVMEGEVRLHIDEEERIFGKGDCVHYTSHPEHHAEVVSHNPVEILWLVLPAMI